MIKFHRWYIEIKGDKLLYWYSKLTGTGGKAQAGAFFPFLITTSKIHPNLREAIINHEQIHFAQQIEKLLIGQWIIMFIESIYYRFYKAKSHMDSYILQPHEQEAYDNMFNLEYLKTRPVFNDLRKYIRNKPITWEWWCKKRLELEGFPIIYDWYDEPNAKYDEHMHKGKVSFFVLEGSVTFSGDINKTVSKWDRFDVPPNTLHSAIVGTEGCKYIVGQEIEGDA